MTREPGAHAATPAESGESHADVLDAAAASKTDSPSRRRGAPRPGAAVEVDVVPVRGLAQRQALVRSRTEAHEQYLNTRDAWLRTMKLASSGRPADLAALAIAQEAYEAAAAEWERWESGSRVAIAIDTEKDVSVGAVVDQELKWRKLHDHDRSSGLIGRITRRLRGR